MLRISPAKYQVFANHRSTNSRMSTMAARRSPRISSCSWTCIRTILKPRALDQTEPCDFDTHGLLQRAHIVANWPPIYIGKESDRHWEEGEDLSLLEFKAVQYERGGNAVADHQQVARIAQVPKREFMRRGINQHTLEKICRGEAVRAINLAKCLKVLEEYEGEKRTDLPRQQ